MILRACSDHLLAAARQALADRRLEESLQLFTAAEHSGCDAAASAAGRWEVFMLKGDFERAWLESDWLAAHNPDDMHRLWKGAAIAGRRVILRCLHGLGDAVQFLRYAKQLRSIADELFVQVAPELVPLASCIAGVGRAITWEELSPLHRVNWDVEIEVMQLPYLFRTTIDSIPSRIPYMELPYWELSRVKRAMHAVQSGAHGPRIGVCWSCGRWDPARAVPPALFLRLMQRVEASFYSLQDSRDVDNTGPLQLPANCHHAATLGTGPLKLATVIANLDLVITVDTLVAHLAGALGKPVWLLLQYAADWRWMDGRDDSPWYPTMRIFRQQRPGDWTTVLERSQSEILRRRAYASLG